MSEHDEFFESAKRFEAVMSHILVCGLCFQKMKMIMEHSGIYESSTGIST